MFVILESLSSTVFPINQGIPKTSFTYSPHSFPQGFQGERVPVILVGIRVQGCALRRAVPFGLLGTERPLTGCCDDRSHRSPPHDTGQVGVSYTGIPFASKLIFPHAIINSSLWSAIFCAILASHILTA